MIDTLAFQTWHLFCNCLFFLLHILFFYFWFVIMIITMQRFDEKAMMMSVDDVDGEDGDDQQIGRLEEEAIRRRAKIQELRNKRKLPGDSNQSEGAPNNADRPKCQLPTPKFRSYVPVDAELQSAALPAAKPDNITEHIQGVLDTATDIPHEGELDLTKLAPKKIDWDLKRNIAKKLEKLERRTQIAIAELIRERILASGDAADNLDKVTEDLDAANRNLRRDDVDDDDDL